MSPNKRKRMSTRSSIETPPAKKAWKARGPNFSAPTEMVTFLIGPEGSDEKFSVHKEFACHHSPVLKAAFNSNFLEGESQTYRLEEMSPSAFRLLVQWFYHEEFDIFKEDDLECDDNDEDPEIEKLWVEQDLSLVQLWIVADKLLIRPLQNAVINVLEEFWEEPFVRHGGPSTAWIPYAYEHTTVGSPLRHFAADVCAYKISPEGFASRPEDFPKEVLLDMAMILSKAVSTWKHDDVAMSNDEEETNSDDYISDSEDEDGDGAEGTAASAAPTPGPDGSSANSVAEAGDEDGFDHGAEEDIWVDAEYEYFIADVPELPKYECHRSWRSYYVPEDED